MKPSSQWRLGEKTKVKDILHHGTLKSTNSIKNALLNKNLRTSSLEPVPIETNFKYICNKNFNTL